MSQFREVLEGTALAETLEPAELDVLARHMQRRTEYSDGLIYAQGSPAAGLYVVERGRVRLLRSTPERRFEERIVRSGEFFGEELLLDQPVMAQSAICIDGASLLCLPAGGYRELFSSHPVIVAKLLRLLNDRLRRRLAEPAGTNASSTVPVVAWCGAKDGVGTSFLAATFALAAARTHSLRVALVELDLPFGNLQAHLDVRSERTLGDLVGQEVLADLSPESLDPYAARPHPGLRVFLRPNEFEQLESIEPHHVVTLTGLLQNSADLVVFDCGAHLTGLSVAALDLSDHLYVVSTPDLPGLVAVRNLLGLLPKLGHSRGKVEIVVNRLNPRRPPVHASLASLFESAAAGTFHEDERIAATANEGRVVATAMPEHPIVRRLSEMVLERVRRVEEGIRQPQRRSLLERWLHWLRPDGDADQGDEGAAGSKADTDPERERVARAEFAFGEAHFLKGRYDVAAQAFHAAIEADGGLAAAHYHLGCIADFDRAVELRRHHLTAARDLEPANLIYAGAAALASGEPPRMREALERLRSVLRVSPRFPDHRLLAARLLFALGDDSSATTEIEAAVTVNPSYVEAFTVLGARLVETGRATDGLPWLVKALELRDSHVPALFALGLAMLEMDLVVLAQRCFSAVLALHRGHRPTHAYLVELQSVIDVLVREIDRYGEASRLQPRFGDYAYRLAVAHFQLAHFEECRLDLARAAATGFEPDTVARLYARLDAAVPLASSAPVLGGTGLVLPSADVVVEDLAQDV